jgi:hypothetical protein
MKWSKVFQFAAGIGCFALALWSAKLMAYNWWAAGGPPVKNAEAYAARGNAFALAALVLIVASVVLIVRFFKRSNNT